MKHLRVSFNTLAIQFRRSLTRGIHFIYDDDQVHLSDPGASNTFKHRCAESSDGKRSDFLLDCAITTSLEDDTT
jgi:hypothetical protein